jgi:methyl-accepting chemotaxis protein
MLAFAITGLAFLVFLAFAIYRFAIVLPLRNLERSCKDLAEHGMRGSVWGVDRTDMYGSVARSISDMRKAVVQLGDMTVESPDGVHLIRFTGRGATAFNTLINDLQSHVRTMQESSSELSRKLEQTADHWQKKADIMGDAVLQTSSSLHEAVESSRQQLDILHGSHLGVQNEAKRLVTRFEADMDAVKEIAAAAGQRVAKTLVTLSTSDRDLRRAAEQNLEASDVFSRHATDLSEKLVAATNLMRASGKVMSETTEAARTRFLEAVQSVEQHDQALRGFLAETAGKTDQIAGLYNNLAGNSERIGQAVDRLEIRLGEFDVKSSDAFSRLSNASTSMDVITTQLGGAHQTMAASMDSMRGHTEMLARILSTLRDEYAGMIDAVNQSLQEANPAISQLKEASQNIHGQLQHEWRLYAEQSRGLLGALEQEVRTIHVRTAEVSSSTEELVVSIRNQSERLNHSATNFDLQVGAVSERIENAVSSVIESNQHIATSTTAQMEEIHGAVNEMAQRLSILTQLAGTLGAVAGQLGQIVPGLSDMSHLSKSVAAPAGMNARFEQINREFTEALSSMRGEFEGVKDQVSQWVSSLSNGYQQMATQIGTIDEVLEKRFNAVISAIPAAVAAPAQPAAPPVEVNVNAGEVASKLAPSLMLIHATLTDEAAFGKQTAQNIETLREELAALRENVMSSSATLRATNELLVDGFNRLQAEEGSPAAAPGPAPALIEKLEKITQEMNASSISDVVNRLKYVTDSLERITELGPMPPNEKAG